VWKRGKMFEQQTRALVHEVARVFALSGSTAL
jgi:hypothetical protein